MAAGAGGADLGRATLVLPYYGFSIGITFYKWLMKVRGGGGGRAAVVTAAVGPAELPLPAASHPAAPPPHLRSLGVRPRTGALPLRAAAGRALLGRLPPPGGPPAALSTSLDIALSNWSFVCITVSLYTMTKPSALLFILLFFTALQAGGSGLPLSISEKLFHFHEAGLPFSLEICILFLATRLLGDRLSLLNWLGLLSAFQESPFMSFSKP